MKINLNSILQFTCAPKHVGVVSTFLTLSLTTSMASANDNELLLLTGSCNGCVIEDLDLSGRNIKWDSVANSTLRRINLDRANLTIKSLDRSTLESFSAVGSTISISSISDSTITDGNGSGSNFFINSATDSTFDRLRLNQANLHFRLIDSFLGSNLGSHSSNWRFDSGDGLEIRSSTVSSSTLVASVDYIQFDRVNLTYSKANFISSRDPRVTSDVSVLDSKLIGASVNWGQRIRFYYDYQTNLSEAVLNGRRCATNSVGFCM